MRVVWSWLLELCDLDRQITAHEGAAALTRGGLEIEGVVALGDGFSGVVVAEVVAKRPHPDAAKLTLVDVIVERGGAVTQVVCGAANVPEPGRKVVWARVGARLPNGMTLAEKPVKGIVSPGMLCAEDELGIDGAAAHAGIIVLDADDTTPLGAPAQRALGLDDHVLELNAAANRGDVLGHLGVARELCAMVGGRVVFRSPDAGDAAAAALDASVSIADAALCPRYTARVIDGVRVAPSPRRIAERLRAVGVRPISNLVDITNYVMFELGQPLHAFDLDRLPSRDVRVAPAADGEQLVTLDGQTRTLVDGDVVIRSGDHPVALAGVMGGLATEVHDGTTRVLLEAASFARGPRTPHRARRLGLALASRRAPVRARRRPRARAELASPRAPPELLARGGGRAVGAIDAYPGKRARTTIAQGAVAARARADRRADARRGAVHVRADPAGLRRGDGPSGAGQRRAVGDPAVGARADLTREVDVIGGDPARRRLRAGDVVAAGAARRAAAARCRSRRPRARRARRVRLQRGDHVRIPVGRCAGCAALGVAATDRRAQPIAVRNPMSLDQAVMRTSLLTNLVAAVARNASFGRADVDLFEVGSVFLRRGEAVVEAPPAELPDEPTWAAGVLAGRRPAGVGLGTPYDAFDAKARALVAIHAIAGELAVDDRRRRAPCRTCTRASPASW